MAEKYSPPEDEQDEIIDLESDAEIDNEDEAPLVHYDITSYGIDFDVEGLVKRIGRGTILVPEFQRNYVWTLPEASRFIESLLLGLPVPGIFLAHDSDTGKMYVIDGQQRLLSLQFFLSGYFKPKKDASSNRLFRLTGVQKQFNGLLFSELPEAEKENLNNSVIHATVVKQDSPDDGDTSMYHIFGRLNSGGRRLTPQEIRTAVYHGPLIDTLKAVNDHHCWRQVFGPEDDRMKDRELILRFFAMYEKSDQYKKPMSEFLNSYARKNRKRAVDDWQELASLFIFTLEEFITAVPDKLFRPVRSFNVAVFEACMIGLARAQSSGVSHSPKKLAALYSEFLNHPRFKSLIFASTSDVQVTSDRLRISTEIFSKK